MAYIETHQTLFTHRKTLRLARLLSMDKFGVAGRLMAFWCWALDNAPDGAIETGDADILADVMGWQDDPHMLISALISSGFLEDAGAAYHIHDWMDYAGRLIEKRKSDAERKRRERTEAPHNRDIQRTSNGHLRDGAGTVPDPIVADPTVPRVEYSRPVPRIGLQDEMLHADARSLVSYAVACGKPDLAPLHRTPSLELPTITSLATGTAEQMPGASAAQVTPSDPTSSRQPRKQPSAAYAEDSPEVRLAYHLKAMISAANPDVRVPENLNSWAAVFHRMLYDDNRSYEGIKNVIEFALTDPFWQAHIISATKVRDKFPTLAGLLRAKQQAEEKEQYGRRELNHGDRGMYRGFARAAGSPHAADRGSPRTPASQPTLEQRADERERNKRLYGFDEWAKGYDHAS